MRRSHKQPVMTLRGAAMSVLWSAVGAGAVLVEAPTADNFLRRSMAKAAVLGDYVYIDGGLLTQLEDGALRGRGQNQANTTLSLPLTTSWTSREAPLTSIPKTAPIKANQILWADPSWGDAGAFYTFGGQSWLGQNMTDSEVWRFTADGKGGGRWSLVTPSNPAVFNSIKQTEHATVAYTNDTGFAIGGLATGWTEKNRGVTQATPGLTTFNFKTNAFTNGTGDLPAQFDGLVGGQARYIPSFGPNGLIVMLGGVTVSVEKYTSVADGAGVEFTELVLFDPVTKEVLKQKTTGDVPPAPRVNFCNVGFVSPQGYDIFIFGGNNERDKITYEDAYVLSLPGFVWTKVANSPAGTRLQHACVAVGKRQVLVVGGTTGSGMKSPDPAPQGLHLFDMTSMSWKYGYEANDGPYESGKAIKDWYANGSLANVKWTNSRVQAMFTNGTGTNGSAGSAGGGSSGGSSSADNANNGNNNSSESSKGKTPIGAIVGGVLGGLALLLIIAVVAFVLVRKKRRQPAAELGAGGELPPSYHDAPRLGVTGPAHVVEAPGVEGPKYMYAAEMTAGDKYSRHEADANQTYSEIYSPAVKDPHQVVSFGVEPVEMDAGNVREVKK
ncbi:hypothetical protein QBC43DRAFT_271938 [Cladorrhinum sp. PSN259]|nr:hypothetical protein QBC43DRAFT_271938 [Cladorrhinum sp. PSN259]